MVLSIFFIYIIRRMHNNTDIEQNEERQTAREIKILVIVFIFGILVSFIIQKVYGPKYFKFAAIITTVFIYMLVSAMIGRIMWNNYVIEIIPSLKPARGFEYILALMIFSTLVLRA